MIYKLYNGEIKMDFNEGVHRYKINGVYKEGVTTLINSVTSKDGLINWAANLSANTFRDEISRILTRNGSISQDDIETCLDKAKTAHTAKKDKGADTGTEVHALINHYITAKINNEPYNLEATSTSAKHSLDAFLEWERKYQPEYLHSEKPIYSLTYDYCGTFDCMAKIDGKLTMIDFKTANPNANWKTGEIKPYPKDFIQCSAYDLAFKEEFKTSCQQYMIVYVTKTGDLYTFIDDEVEATQEAWISALTLARHNKKLSTKKIHNNY